MALGLISAGATEASSSNCITAIYLLKVIEASLLGSISLITAPEDIVLVYVN